MVVVVDRASATRADDLAAGVHCDGRAVGAPKGAEVDHPARWRPREGMVAGNVGKNADDLTADVHREGLAPEAAEGVEIDWDEKYLARRPSGSRDCGEKNREHHHENKRSCSPDAKACALVGMHGRRSIQ